jgi:hypothetical protein
MRINISSILSKLKHAWRDSIYYLTSNWSSKSEFMLIVIFASTQIERDFIGNFYRV